MVGMTILIPHKNTPLNDKALEINLKMLHDNTINRDCETLIMSEKNDPYVLWNEYALKAKHEHLVFSNSDVLMAAGWDVYLQKYVDDNSIVTGYLVEPGIIGVASQNIHLNYGKSPNNFDRTGFEKWAESRAIQTPEMKEERGWYMPCIMTKTFFLRMGRFPVEKAFPNPNDIIFWEHCLKNGAKLKRVRSFAYHLQNLSNSAHDYKRKA